MKKSEFRFSRAFFSNDKNPKPNVLILGNSRGLNGIYAPDLNEYGYEAFNLSYNGMNLELAKIVLESYLINNPKPDKLILEISNIYGDSSLSNSLKMYSGESSDLSEFIDKNTGKKIQIFDIFIYTVIIQKCSL